MFEDTLHAKAETIPIRQIRLITHHKNAICHTLVDTMGTMYLLSYNHSVYNKKGDLLQDYCSVMQYMGLASQTYWYEISEDQLNEMIEALSIAVREFVAFLDSDWE